MTDNTAGGKRKAKGGEQVHRLFTASDPSLRKDGLRTSMDPTVQLHLAKIRANFEEYVKVTERGYEAKKAIPKDCPIGYFSGKLTKDPPGVFQTVTLCEDKHVLADISDPFEVGCIALMTQDCKNPNCQPFAIHHGRGLLPVAEMYTTKVIDQGKLLTTSWADFYISKEQAEQLKDEYSGDQLKPCKCRHGCPNVYYLDPEESDPFQAYLAAYRKHIQAMRGESDPADVRRSARGSGGAAVDDVPQPGPVSQRLDGRPSRAMQIVRSSLDNVEELLLVCEGVPNPVREVLDFDDGNVNSVIKEINREFVGALPFLKLIVHSGKHLTEFETENMGIGIRNGGARSIPANANIMVYIGVVRPSRRACPGPYIFESSLLTGGVKVTFDARDHLHIPGIRNMALVNHKCKESRPNCQTVSIGKNQITQNSGFFLALKTVEEIPPGDELFYDYSGDYWSTYAKVSKVSLKAGQSIVRCMCAPRCPNGRANIFPM